MPTVAYCLAQLRKFAEVTGTPPVWWCDFNKHARVRVEAVWGLWGTYADVDLLTLPARIGVYVTTKTVAGYRSFKNIAPAIRHCLDLPGEIMSHQPFAGRIPRLQTLIRHDHKYSPWLHVHMYRNKDRVEWRDCGPGDWRYFNTNDPEGIALALGVREGGPHEPFADWLIENWPAFEELWNK